MEAACTAGEVVAIKNENGQMTIIQFEANSSANLPMPTDLQSSSTLQSPDVQSPTSATVMSEKECNTRDESDAGIQLAVVNRWVKNEVEVSVQANDYEIERATGILPARKRFIPLKYRDFRSPDEVEEEDKQDSDYEPEPLFEPKDPVAKKKRGRGRPRKYPEVKSNTAVDSEAKKPQMMRTPNGYKCLTCSRVFSQKGNLKVHLLTHTDHRPWVCDIDNCNKAFRTKESLRRHKLSHMGIKPFECTECKKKFCSALSLQEHSSRHSNIRPYTCPECQRSFRQVSCLRRHLLTHSSILPHTCELCGRSFSQAIYLRSHMKVHTGEKPHSCDQCNKSFAHASDLTRHKIIHSDTKPYSCSVCTMRFNDPSSRRRHEREHLGTKPYSCHLCSEGFKRASQLRAHLYRRHGGLKEGVEFRIQEGPEPVCYRIELHEEQGSGVPAATKVLDFSALDQKKIISLIQNLNRNMVVQELEVAAGETVSQSTSENSQTAIDTEQVILPVEMATVMDNVEESSGNVITIAEIDSEQVQELGPTYQILHGLGGEGEGQGHQVYEVHYHSTNPSTEETISTCTSSDPLETVTTTLVSDTTPTTTTVLTVMPKSSSENASVKTSTSSTSSIEVSHSMTSPTAVHLDAEYVVKPDFGSQDYYDWLSSFTEVCKLLPVPLEVDLFQKISQMHKTLSDFMASPSGVIADKDNFKILMSISKDLNHILNDHLTCMLQNLSDADNSLST